MIILTVFLQNNKNITEQITARYFIFCFYLIKQIKIERVMNSQNSGPRGPEFVWPGPQGPKIVEGIYHIWVRSTRNRTVTM